MFAIVHMSDVVRIPPNRLTNSLKDAAIQILKEKYESMISPDVGYVIMITDADASSVGKLVAGDPPTKEALLHRSVYDVRPKDGAIVHLHSTHAVAISCLDPSCHHNKETTLPPITPLEALSGPAITVLVAAAAEAGTASAG